MVMVTEIYLQCFSIHPVQELCERKKRLVHHQNKSNLPQINKFLK